MKKENAKGITIIDVKDDNKTVSLVLITIKEY